MTFGIYIIYVIIISHLCVANWGSSVRLLEDMSVFLISAKKGIGAKIKTIRSEIVDLIGYIAAVCRCGCHGLVFRDNAYAKHKMRAFKARKNIGWSIDEHMHLSLPKPQSGYWCDFTSFGLRILAIWLWYILFFGRNVVWQPLIRAIALVPVMWGQETLEGDTHALRNSARGGARSLRSRWKQSLPKNSQWIWFSFIRHFV